jgi:hypothetical protein
MSFNFEVLNDKKNIELSTKLIGVIVHEVLEKQYSEGKFQKSLEQLKNEITQKVNEYLKLPIVSIKMEEDSEFIQGHIEIRNRVPMNFKLEKK